MACLHELRAMALLLAGALAACASAPRFGAIGETPAAPTRITAVDSSYPPHSLSVQLDQAAYAVVLLVAPGHSATLLYPADSAMNNRLDAGTHRLYVTVPDNLVPRESGPAANLLRPRDTVRVRPSGPTIRSMPILPTTPTYLLVITSPQPLSYARIVAKTTGVTIPLQDLEALNAVGKTVKATILADQREWSGYYQQVSLSKPAS